MKNNLLRIGLLGMVFIAVAWPLAAQAQAYGFSPEKATDAYLASMPPAAKAKSDAYWNGGYWIKLKNSARVEETSQKSPRMHDVFMTEFCFSTPRIIMHRCCASITTATP